MFHSRRSLINMTHGCCASEPDYWAGRPSSLPLSKQKTQVPIADSRWQMQLSFTINTTKKRIKQDLLRDKLLSIRIMWSQTSLVSPVSSLFLWIHEIAPYFVLQAIAYSLFSGRLLQEQRPSSPFALQYIQTHPTASPFSSDLSVKRACPSLRIQVGRREGTRLSDILSGELDAQVLDVGIVLLDGVLR